MIRIRYAAPPEAVALAAALVVTVAAAALSATPVGGQVASPASADDVRPAERCRSPEHRQFDFWLGFWEVRSPVGDLVGHNDISRAARGCGILESWYGVGGGRGVSVNGYDPDRGRWTQRWIGDGAALWLEGGLEGEAMVLTGRAPRGTPAGEVLDRITWTPLQDGRVRQVWEVSADGGAAWREVFVGLYARALGAGEHGQDAAGYRAGLPCAVADVASPEAIVRAMYETINRRPGEPFDWDRLRTLFLSEAIMIPSLEQTGGVFRMLSVEDFIAWVDEHTTVGGATDRGFREEEIARRTERYGDIAQVFSTYQKRYWDEEEILGRGINAIQLVRVDDRWWVAGVVWDEEVGAGPMPERYLPE